MTAIIINEGDSPNLGDKAIRFCMVQLFTLSGVDTICYPYTDSLVADLKFGSKSGTKVFKRFFLPIKALVPVGIRKFIYRVRWKRQKESQIAGLNIQADIAVIGGGQLLNLNRNFPIAFDLWTKYLYKAGVPVYCIGIGYGDTWKGCDARLLKKSLGRITKIQFRDTDSQERIMGQFGVNSEFIYDVAFCISDFIPQNKQLREDMTATVIPASYKYVVSQYNQEKTLKDYLQELTDCCKSLIRDGFQINLSISEKNQDKDIVTMLSDYLNKNSIKHTIQIPDTLSDFCNIISSSDLVFSGRMHALIIGYSYEKQCLVYRLSDKLKSFEQEIIKKGVSIQDIKNNIYKTIRSVIRDNNV